MLISASRRTDIPAFYSKWFINRVREGHCYVPNPLNMHLVSKISLLKKDVEAIIFWSKNPAPLLPYLDELDEYGFYYYFQFTLNAYPWSLEPNVPMLDKRIETFKDLSERIGKLRVVWRYDPVIISNITDFDFHREKFQLIAKQLKGSTQRVMISIVDFYKKTERRLSQLEKEENYFFQRDALALPGTRILLRDIADIAHKNNMEIFSCAEENDFSNLGIPHGKCIDNQLVNKIWTLNISYKKDPYQRKSCFCNLSKDIGINDTCMHGCPYCYATIHYEVAQRRFKEHNANSPILWGKDKNLKNINEEINSQMSLFPED